MWWLVVGALLVVTLARPLVRLYRSATPRVVGAVDATSSATAFDEEHRVLLVDRGFADHGARLIDISGAPVVLHLWQRSADGTTVVGCCHPDGSLPKHHLVTVLAEGRGWLETRTTDRTPGPREELVQVVPGAPLDALIDVHDRALDTLVSMGVGRVRSLEPFAVLVHQGERTRRSLRHNPLRWTVGLLSRTAAPDRASELDGDRGLDRWVRTLGLAA